MKSKTGKPSEKQALKIMNADLVRKIEELEAQMIHVLNDAHKMVGKAGYENMMASGVIVSLTALGGRKICPDFCIKDGLSQDTIASLREDIVASWKKLVDVHPQGK